MSDPKNKEMISPMSPTDIKQKPNAKPQPGNLQPLVVEDINLDDPATVEFAVYSSGGLDIYTDGCSIMLAAPVFDKLLALIERFPRGGK